MATNPRYAPEANPAVLQRLEFARREMREFLGGRVMEELAHQQAR